MSPRQFLSQATQLLREFKVFRLFDFFVVLSCNSWFLQSKWNLQPSGQFREKRFAILDPNALILYARANFLKTMPSTAPHTYIARVWQYAPLPGTVLSHIDYEPTWTRKLNANPSFHWLKPLVTTIYPVVVTDLSNCSRCNLALSQNIAQKSIVTECVCLSFILASFSLTYVVLSPLEARLCFPSWRLCNLAVFLTFLPEVKRSL